LLIKKELHKFYDVNRATSEMDVAGPLFSQLPEVKSEAGVAATGAAAAQEGKLDAALAQKVGEYEAFKKASAVSLAEKDAALAEKDTALAKKDAALSEKESALTAALAEKDAALAAALAEKDAALAAALASLAEKDSSLAEKDASKVRTGTLLDKVKELQAELERCRGELRKDAKPGGALPPPPPPPGETALYSWEVLKEGCPQGVDPKHKELALQPEQFKEALGVEKEDWAGMPKWKKQQQKKAAGLF
jgi:DNA repair exonuclease SbcCD ATPase subunit